MANRPSMCLIVLFAVVGKFGAVVSDGQNADPSMYLPMPIPIPVQKEPDTFPPVITPTEPVPAGNGTTPTSNCPCGLWYAVMATEVSSDGPCSTITNNKYPCCCSTMVLRELHDTDLEVICSTENIETFIITVDMGGATAETQEYKEINGFVISLASVPADTIDVFPQMTIASNVDGCPVFAKYHMSILDWNTESGYMIAQVKTDNGPDPFHVIFCRNSHPGKETIWTSILGGLKQLNIDPHSMIFIKQDNCTYPSVLQYDEMSFC